MNRLLQVNSPSLDTIKMQVHFDMNYSTPSKHFIYTCCVCVCVCMYVCVYVILVLLSTLIPYFLLYSGISKGTPPCFRGQIKTCDA